MSGTKISALTSLSTVSDSTLVLAVDGGQNYKLTAATIKTYTSPAASTSVLGGVIIPAVATSGISNSSGTIGLATASNSQLGGVIVDGSSITISSGIISAVNVLPRTGSIINSTIITPTAATSDIYVVTALGADATVVLPSGTPVNGQKLLIRIKTDGTTRNLTWTTTAGGYRALLSGALPLPSSVTTTNVLYVEFIYNSQDNYWDLIRSIQ